jgi:succinate dehydrogenase/fumarate reductase flavoprotein subunit
VASALPRLDCDVVVLGGGLGGVTAALRAAQLGQRVILIEAGGRLGGTAALSGGGIHIWGCHSFESYRERCPTADERLLRALFDNYQRYVDWLTATRAPGEFGITSLRGLSLEKYQIGGSMLPAHKQRWFDYFGRQIRSTRGQVLLNTRARQLRVRDGRVCGVTVDASGGTQEIAAHSVIMATGGFQGSAALLERHVSPAAAQFVCRAVAHNDGSGLAMAESAGATLTSGRMDTVYGHLMPAAPCRMSLSDPLDPTFLSAFYAEHGILVNAQGQRFVDEGRGELDGTTINAAAQQAAGGLWVIMDEATRVANAQYELPPEALRISSLRHWRKLRYLRLRRGAAGWALVLDSLQYARDRGAVIVSAHSLDELRQALATQGVDSLGLRQTITRFNAAATNGSAGALPVPKCVHVNVIARAPFHAVKVVPGISMTYGGVAIDTEARALDVHGAPVPGLYAVPGAAGGVQHLYYGGALAACGVYGLIAAESASRRAAPATR